MGMIKYLLMMGFLLLGKVAYCQPKMVSIPLDVAKEMWKDVVTKNELKVELNQADSTITVYEAELLGRGKKITEFGLAVDEYKVLIKKMDEQHALDVAKNEDCQKNLRTENRKNKGLTIAAIVEAVIIIVLSLKE